MVEDYWKAKFDESAESAEHHKTVLGTEAHYHNKRLAVALDLVKDEPHDILFLDVGCGIGLFSASLKKHGFTNIVGVDYSLPQLKRNKELSSNEIMLQCEIYNLPFKDNSFDYCLCIGVLQYLGKPEDGIKEALRVTKKGGKIILNTLNKNFLLYLLPRKERRLRRYSLKNLCQLLKKEKVEITLTRNIVLLPKIIRHLEGVLEKIPCNSVLSHDILVCSVKKCCQENYCQ